MSEPSPCPHQPQLVTLLGDEPDAALRDHLATCARCRAELASLRDGFTALGEDPLVAEKSVQERIAARVMPQILADLGRMPTGVADVRPRPRTLAALTRLALLGALTALAVVPAVLYWTKLGDEPLQPTQALGLALLPLGLLPAVLGAPLLRRGALAFAIAMTAAIMLATVGIWEVGALHGAGCLLLAASGSLLPAAIVLRTAAKQLAGVLPGALLGAAIASGGAAVQRLFCSSSDLAHTLIFHLGPFLFLIALAGLLGSRAARHTAPIGPTPQQAA